VITISIDEILALLEEQPYTVEALAAALRVPVDGVRALLPALAEDVATCERCPKVFLRYTSDGNANRFCSRTCYAQPAADLAAKILALVEPGPKRTAEIAAALDIATSTAILHLKPMLRDGRLEKIGGGPQQAWCLPSFPRQTFYPTAKSQRPGTRQPHERPPSAKIAKDRPPSWWVGLSREQLEATARDRAAGMSAARESRYVSGKPSDE
jgi:hypothetical protein